MPTMTLDQIIDALDRSHQRATYGAVGSLLGQAPRTLMKGRERDRRHSWIVNNKTGEPTGYDPDLLHPDLRERDTVIETKEELGRWIETVEAGV